MNMLPKTPAPWPSTSRLAVYWLVAVVVFEAVDCSLLWHMDWFIAWGVSPFALITLTPVLLIMGVWLVVAGIVAGLRS